MKYKNVQTLICGIAILVGSGLVCSSSLPSGLNGQSLDELSGAGCDLKTCSINSNDCPDSCDSGQVNNGKTTTAPGCSYKITGETGGCSGSSLCEAYKNLECSTDC